MSEAQAQQFAWNPFDLTKIWPHADYPLIEVGILELNRNPDNYFAEVEQSAFGPSATVPGISWSPDKVLQARLMSYADAHRYRVGNNYQQWPVNKPRCLVMHYQRDGAMSQGEGGSAPNYYPNSYDDTPTEHAAYAEPPLQLGEVAADRYDSCQGHDDYTQAGNLYRLLSAPEKERLHQAIAGSLGQTREELQLRQLEHFFTADTQYGQGVARALGLNAATVGARVAAAE